MANNKKRNIKIAQKHRAGRPSLLAEVFYAGESIDIKRAQENLKQYTFLNRESPLVIRLLDDQLAVLTKFGTVAFWNVGEKLKKQFLSEVSVAVKSVKTTYPYREKTRVAVGGEYDRVTFDKVTVTELNLQRIKIISYVLSQSVALERYEDEIEENLNELGKIIENLKSQGRPVLHEREILRQIGRVLSIKQIAVAHLSLFDKPTELWEAPELERLYNKLHQEYEIGDRFDILSEKINFLSDNAKMLMDFIAEKRNAFLEMVIIVLIVIELIPLFIDLVKYLTR